MGLHGEMLLRLASGPVKIADLYDRTVSSPKTTEVALVWTGARLFVSEISDVRSIGTEQVFEVELDDDSVIQVSASSRFTMKSGRYKLAPELKPGDSLLPLYLGSDFYGYPTYQIPGKGAKRKIYRLMAEWKQGFPLARGTVVEHIDTNRKNYHPDNLRITPNMRSVKRTHKHKLVRACRQAQQFLDECASASPRIAKIAESARKTNHKVKRVTPGRLESVYTASVKSGGSVSVSGVFLELPA